MDKIDEILNKIEVVSEIIDQQLEEGYFDKNTADCYFFYLNQYTDKILEEYKVDNKEIKNSIKILRIVIGINIFAIILSIVIALI